MKNIQHIVVIDYESYYDKDYSLSKMPTHQYIRDPRWECLGCGFQFDREEPFYTTDPEAVFRKIDAIGWDNVACVAHNAFFDGSVLWERFGRRSPGLWLDTQLIARWAVAQGHLAPTQGVSLAKLAPLVGMEKGDTWKAVHGGGQGLADYGVDDVKIERALLDYLMEFNPPSEELEYMDMHIRMGTEPVLGLDHDLLREATVITPQEAKLNELLRKDGNMVSLLEKLGVEVEYKVTPKGNRKPALAKTDKFMQGLTEHPDDIVADLATRRLNANSSITRTRAQTMLNVGEPLPCPYLYYGAHTGRASGSDGYNMQNLPNVGPIRAGIVAPPGYVLLAGDSRQIEARAVAWRAGARRLLDTFRTEDPYCTFGGDFMFGCPPGDLTDEQRKIAKAGLLGLGFGQGWRGLMASSARQRLIIPEHLSKLAQDSYRHGNPEVPQWWRRLKRMALEDGHVTMPDGRRIIYDNLREEPWSEDNPELTLVYDRPTIFSKNVKRGQRQRVRFWHGLACLALDTLVLTRDGWVPLGEVGLRPVWDGVEWVTHKGLTTIQYKTTIRRNGVRLTSDHRVLTDEGWKPAAESKESKGESVRLAHPRTLCGKRRTTEPVGVSMPLREYARVSLDFISQWGREALRFLRVLSPVPLPSLSGSGRYSRHEQTSGLLRLAIHGGSVHVTYPSSMAKLRRAWNYGVRPLAKFLRVFLGGYGPYVQIRVDTRPERQRPRLLPAELPMGFAPPAGQESAEFPLHRHSMGLHNSGRSQRAERDRCDNVALPAGSGLAYQGFISEAVADLADCGPRNRFVVCAPGGAPFYAHNCENDTQGTARSVVFWQAMKMRQDGIPVVGMSHDEVISMVPEADAWEAQLTMEYWLRQVPPWAEGLPVDGKVKIGNNYKECK